MFVFAALMKAVSPCIKATWILSKHLKQHDCSYSQLLTCLFFLNSLPSGQTLDSLDAKPYMDFMQSARIDDVTWLSTSENFIPYWKYQHNMYQNESLRYDFFLHSELIAMLNAAVCSIKELHHVKIQCDSDGSTYDAYVSHLIDAASQYNFSPYPKYSKVVGTCLE